MLLIKFQTICSSQKHCRVKISASSNLNLFCPTAFVTVKNSGPCSKMGCPFINFLSNLTEKPLKLKLTLTVLWHCVISLLGENKYSKKCAAVHMSTFCWQEVDEQAGYAQSETVRGVWRERGKRDQQKNRGKKDQIVNKGFISNLIFKLPGDGCPS